LWGNVAEDLSKGYLGRAAGGCLCSGQGMQPSNSGCTVRCSRAVFDSYQMTIRLTIWDHAPLVPAAWNLALK